MRTPPLLGVEESVVARGDPGLDTSHWAEAESSGDEHLDQMVAPLPGGGIPMAARRVADPVHTIGLGIVAVVIWTTVPRLIP